MVAIQDIYTCLLTGHAQFFGFLEWVATLWTVDWFSFQVLHPLSPHMVVTEAYLAAQARVLPKSVAGRTYKYNYNDKVLLFNIVSTK